jgi:PadR family transcriptional regulator, regulatory protein PadR
MTTLGSAEEAIMLAIYSLGRNAYGISVYDALQSVGRKTSIGALYTTIGRLEEKGYIKSRNGEPTPERGGRAKTYFSVTGTGVEVLNMAEESRIALRNLKPGLAGGQA